MFIQFKAKLIDKNFLEKKITANTAKTIYEGIKECKNCILCDFVFELRDNEFGLYFDEDDKQLKIDFNFEDFEEEVKDANEELERLDMYRLRYSRTDGKYEVIEIKSLLDILTICQDETVWFKILN